MSDSLATPWTAAYQASLSMGFSRHEYWSGVPLLTVIIICSGKIRETLALIRILALLSDVSRILLGVIQVKD